jgi:hypothetical protein
MEVSSDCLLSLEVYQRFLRAVSKARLSSPGDGVSYKPVYPAFTGSLLPSSWRK